MTPLNVTDNPARYYAWLQWAMSPVPEREDGTNANASEQTIEGAQPLNRGPYRKSFCLSEDECFVSSPPVSDVDNQAGRAAS